MATLSAMAEEDLVLQPLVRLRRSPVVVQRAGRFARCRGIPDRDVDTCGRNRKIRHRMDQTTAPQSRRWQPATRPIHRSETAALSLRRAPRPLLPLWRGSRPSPYLSVVLSNFSPNRLVIDPAGNYFWLSCATATQTARPIARFRSRLGISSASIPAFTGDALHGIAGHARHGPQWTHPTTEFTPPPTGS